MAMATPGWTTTASDAPFGPFVAPSPFGEMNPDIKALHPGATQRRVVPVA